MEVSLSQLMRLLERFILFVVMLGCSEFLLFHIHVCYKQCGKPFGNDAKYSNNNRSNVAPRQESAHKFPCQVNLS